MYNTSGIITRRLVTGVYRQRVLRVDVVNCPEGLREKLAGFADLQTSASGGGRALYFLGEQARRNVEAAQASWYENASPGGIRVEHSVSWDEKERDRD
jgi:hypothetical protein